MKAKTLTTILLLASLGVMGQSKSKSTFKLNGATTATSSATQKNFIGASISLVPTYFIVADQKINKAWLRIEGKPQWNNPDSLILYVKKSQLRWINDSTAVITK